MPDSGSDEFSAAELSVGEVVEPGADLVADPAAPVSDPVAPVADLSVDPTAPVADPAAPVISERLLGARDLALAALHEITPAASVGPAAGYQPEADGVLSLRFENRLAGYPGWFWTVTVAQVGDDEPTVLEAELLPGAGALLAPDWVPWAERLADYRAHQVELAAEADLASAARDGSDAGATESGSGDDESDLDLDDLDGDDLDGDEDDAEADDLAPRLHAGDVDGVDIDEFDDSAEEDDPEDEDSEDDDSEDDEDRDSEEE